MDLWKTLAIAVIVLSSTQAIAAENNNPFQGALMITTIVPAVIISAPTAITSEIPEYFKSAKTDALTFIGSDDEIRGAEFEQASRYYRFTYASPVMSDMQLAQAIVTSF
ncbi:DUF2388 domain-containing protein [Pseudomonas iridis]|uniref:DUF2388 domain-containing protein n=1 Tax=Pseudomonas iridis TaxID=2710587 RepID=UPI0037C8004E